MKRVSIWSPFVMAIAVSAHAQQLPADLRAETVKPLFEKSWFETRDFSQAETLAQQYLRSLKPDALGDRAASDLLNFMQACAKSNDHGFHFPVDSMYKVARAVTPKADVLRMSQARWARLAGETAEAARMADEFIGQLPARSLRDKAVVEFISEFTKRSDDKGFKLVIDHLATVDRTMGLHYGERLLGWIIHREEIAPLIKSAQEPDWAALTEAMEKKYGVSGRDECLRSKMYYYANHQSYREHQPAYQAKFREAAMAYMDKYLPSETDAMRVNNFAWEFFLHASDRHQLEKALQWSRRAVEMEAAANWMDTLANLLYKLGRKDEAIAMQRKVVSMEAGNAGFSGNLEKMLAGQPTWPGN